MSKLTLKINRRRQDAIGRITRHFDRLSDDYLVALADRIESRLGTRRGPRLRLSRTACEPLPQHDSAFDPPDPASAISFAQGHRPT